MFSTSKTHKSGKNGEGVISIIGRDSLFKGELICDSDVHVEGRIEGSVRAHVVHVSEDADIKGDILCKMLEVRGKVTGNIDADIVHLGHRSHVDGNITYSEIEVASGAFLNGECHHRDKNRLSGAEPEQKPEDANAPEKSAKLEIFTGKTG